MHRNNSLIPRFKLLALAAALVLCPIASTCGQLVPGSEESDAAKGPGPRLELQAEAKLPGVDPAMRRGVVRVDQTLLNAPSSNTAVTEADDPFEGTSQRAPATSKDENPEENPFDEMPFESTPAEDMQAELAATRAELTRTKKMVGEMLQEYKQIAESRELPPLKDAEVRVFQLKNTKAAAAADKIELLFGTQPLRIAVDDASNGLIVFGKAEAIPQVEQLIIKLDELSVIGQQGFATGMTLDQEKNAAPAPRRTLLLRLFWLANGVDDLDSADGYLPAPVISSLAKLGLSDPRLVTQTVNSLSVEEGGSSVEFSTNVPAILFEQPVTLTSAGTMGATTDNRADVDMHLTVGGAGVNCELKGSLATPLGHFMVLGTANSVIPDFSPLVDARKKMLEEARAQAQRKAMEEERAREAEEGGMGRDGGYGGRGGEMGRGGGYGMEMGSMPVDTKYNASRFAFVVQVIEAESFEPEGNGQ